MNRSPLLLLAAFFIAIQLSGCTAMESWRSPSAKSTHSANSKSGEQETADFYAADEDDEYEDPRKHVRDETRYGMATEEPLDPWYGKYNYADKGRAIERNLR